jgi:hypothetical protein
MKYIQHISARAACFHRLHYLSTGPGIANTLVLHCIELCCLHLRLCLLKHVYETLTYGTHISHLHISLQLPISPNSSHNQSETIHVKTIKIHQPLCCKMQVDIDWSLEESDEVNHQCEWFTNVTEFSRAFANAKNEGMLHEEKDEEEEAQ